MFIVCVGFVFVWLGLLGLCLLRLVWQAFVVSGLLYLVVVFVADELTV